MSWINLQRCILEDIAESCPRYIESFSCFLVRDPAKNAERSAAWKKEHPARVKAQAAAYRRRRGQTTRVGRPGQPIVDQHGTVYESHRAAAKAIGAHHSGVRAVLRGEYKTIKGYRFTYA